MARFRAAITNYAGVNEVTLQTKDFQHALSIPPRADGTGSSANGGELLFLALAACCCNDIYREAGKRGINVERVEVEVDGDFDAEGAPGKNIGYSVRVKADAGKGEVLDLIRYTDQVVEIHNTLRAGTQVILRSSEVIES